MKSKSQKNMKKGLLIVFEGIDGTGKSTQLDLLAHYLVNKDYPVITTREPTDGQYGVKIRQLYINRDSISKEEELELFINDRKEHVEQLIQPALAEQKIILCDRYFLSTAAYQGAVGFDPQVILDQNSFAPDPDLALLFLANPELSITRIADRGDTLNDFEQQDKLEKVSKLFLSLDKPYILQIDGSGTIETIHQEVVKNVMTLLLKFQLWWFHKNLINQMES